MRTHHPPRVATWLLSRLGSSVDRDVLVGDLMEQYRAGRTSVWYWQQALWAIAVGMARDLRAHPVQAARAVVLGWGLLSLGWQLLALDMWLFVRGLADIRPWWPHSGLWTQALVITCGCLLVGWLLGRFHERSMVLLFAATVIASELRTVVPYVVTQGIPVSVHPAYEFFVILILVPVGIALGGLMSRRASRMNYVARSSATRV